MPIYVIECVEFHKAEYEIETQSSGPEGVREAAKIFLTTPIDQAVRREVRGTNVLAVNLKSR